MKASKHSNGKPNRRGKRRSQSAEARRDAARRAALSERHFARTDAPAA